MHNARRVWQCKSCGARKPRGDRKNGAAQEHRRRYLQQWFWAPCLVATHHPGISAVQLARQLGIRRHETAWMMLHKLRRAMVAPEREPLKGEVEVDEFYLGGLEEGLGGRERVKKTPVGVAIEVRGRGSGRLRLEVLADVSRHSLLPFVQSAVSVDAIVHTDGWKGYDRLSRLGYEHRPRWQTTAPRASSYYRARTAPSRTSRPGCTALTAGRHGSTYPCTWMSTSFVTTDAAIHTPRFRPSSGSAHPPKAPFSRPPGGGPPPPGAAPPPPKQTPTNPPPPKTTRAGRRRSVAPDVFGASAAYRLSAMPVDVLRVADRVAGMRSSV